MKVTPISADLIVKVALGGAILLIAWYGVGKINKGIKDAFDEIAGLPSAAIEKVKEVAREGGAAWLDQTADNPMPEKKYNGPLINNDGIDFGQLSG